MNGRSLSLIVAIFLAAASPAAAQYVSPSSGSDAQQRFFAALRSVALSDDQRSVIRTIVGDGYLNGQSERDIDGRIVAVLDAEQVRALRDRLGYDPIGIGSFVPPPDYRPRLIAVIHRISGNAVSLTNGHTVFMTDSTQIVPSRSALKIGLRIGVDGQPAGDGNINAYDVRAFDDAFTPGPFLIATLGGRFETIAAMTKSNLTLNNGTTVFLRDDTIVAPARDQVQPGTSIVIYGTPAGNGNINADRIDVLPRR